MGLQGYYSTPQQAYGAAYANLSHIIINQDNSVVYVNMYADKSARDNNEFPIYQEQFIYGRESLYDGNVFELAYNKVKLEKVFTGWIDVFEPDPPLAQVIQFPTPDPAPADPVDPNAGA